MDEARRIVDTLDGTVSFYKLGHWLLFQPGASTLIDELVHDGRDVFLDYKMYDIGETVRHGVASVAKRGARFLTVHGDSHILAAAVDGASGSSLGVLAVTVLTSLDDAALQAMGYALNVRDLVMASGARRGGGGLRRNHRFRSRRPGRIACDRGP